MTRRSSTEWCRFSRWFDTGDQLQDSCYYDLRIDRGSSTFSAARCQGHRESERTRLFGHI